MSNSASKAIATLKRLAAVGGPPRQLFPELVRMLGELAPHDTAAMMWLGPDHTPLDTYANFEASPVHFTRYAERWFDNEEGRFYPRQLTQQIDPALAVMKVSAYTPDFGESELYDEIYKPARHHWITGIALRDGDRPIGNLGIGRPPGLPDFSDEEVRHLRLARPFLIQALSRPQPANDWDMADGEDETVMLLTDPDGRVKHASVGAWRLLHGAMGLPANPRLLRDTACIWAEPLLGELCRRVMRSVSGEAVRPASETRVTPYGHFVLRAYAFETEEGPPSLIAVQIEKRLPLPYALFRSRRFLGLSGREQDVARMLTTGLPYPRIADALDLSKDTVVTHVRHLGDKLGVTGRAEIVRALAAA